MLLRVLSACICAFFLGRGSVSSGRRLSSTASECSRGQVLRAAVPQCPSAALHTQPGGRQAEIQYAFWTLIPLLLHERFQISDKS